MEANDGFYDQSLVVQNLLNRSTIFLFQRHPKSQEGTLHFIMAISVVLLSYYYWFQIQL
jgi:hypothetical protein